MAGQVNYNFFVSHETDQGKRKYLVSVQDTQLDVTKKDQLERIKKMICGALEKRESETKGFSQNLESVTLTQDELTKEVKTEEGWEVRPIPFKEHAASVVVKRKSARKIWKKTSLGWVGKVPIVGWLLFVGAFVISYLRRESKQEEAAISLNRLLEHQSPKSPKEFRHLLNRKIGMIERHDPNHPSLTLLKQAVQNSKNIEKALVKGKRAVEDQIGEMAKQLMDSRQTIIIPAGFYAEGVFHPVVYVFSTDDSQKLTLKRWGMGGEDIAGGGLSWVFPAVEKASSEVSDESKYVLVNPALNERKQEVREKTPAEIAEEMAKGSAAAKAAPQKSEIRGLKELMMLMVVQSVSKEAVVSPKIKKELVGFLKASEDLPSFENKVEDEEWTHVGGEKKGPPLTIEPVPAAQLIESRLQDMGVKKEVVGTRAKDGFDLLSMMLGSHNDSAIGYKVQFLIDLINEEIDLLLLSIDHLSPDERDKALKDLDGRLGKLKTLIKDVVKADFEQLVEANLFNDFNEKLKALSKTRARVANASVDRTGENRLLSVADLDQLQLGKTTRAAAEAVQSDVFVENYQALKELRADFKEVKDTQSALDKYSVLAVKVNDLVEKGQYQQALRLAVALQDCLPVPAKEDLSNYWNQFGNAAAESWDKMKVWGTQLDLVTKCQWEASLRLRRAHPTAEESAGLINSRLILQQIARQKSAWVKAKINADGLELELPDEPKAVDVSDTGYRQFRADRNKTKLETYEKMMIEKKSDNEIKNFFDMQAYIEESMLDQFTKDGNAKREKEWQDKLKTSVSTLQQGGFSYEKAAALVFDYYQTDTDQLRDLLQFHPHMRWGMSTALAKKVGQMQAYMIPEKRKLRPMRLDTEVGAKENLLKKASYSLTNDKSYLERLGVVAAVYNKPIEKAKNELQVGKDLVLPPEMVQLRRHVIMSQIIFVSSSLILSFGSSKLFAFPKILRWWSRVSAQARTDTIKDPGQFYERVQELTLEETGQRLSPKVMQGRLDLVMENYLPRPEKSTPVIKATGGESLYYVPRGLNLKGGLKNLFQIKQKIDPAAELSPNVPSEYTNSIVSGGRYTTDPENPSIFEDMEAKTEFDHMQSILKQDPPPEIGIVENFLLRTLHVSVYDDLSPQMIDLAILNVLKIICTYPSLLSKPEARQLFDLTFSHTSQMQALFLNHSAAVLEFAPHLKALIAENLKSGNLEVAGHLLHLSELVRLQAELAIPQLQTIERHQLEEVKGETDRQINRREQEQMRLDQRYTDAKKTIAEWSDKIPGFRTFYQVGEAEVSGLTALERLKTKNPELFAFYKLEADMAAYEAEDDLDNWVSNMSAEDISTFISSQNSLLALPPELVTPFIRSHVSDWMRQSALPAILLRLNADQGLRNQVLDQLVLTVSEGAPIGPWTASAESNIFQKGDYTVNLMSCSIRDKGVLAEGAGFSASLPREALGQFPELRTLAKNSEIKGQIGEEAGGLVYLFTGSDGNKYKVQHAAETGQLYLFGQFSKKPDGVDKQWYQKIYPAQQEGARGAAALACDLGVWVNQDREGIIFLNQLPNQLPFDRILLSLDENGTLTSAVVELDGQNRNINFSSVQAREVCPFANPNHVLYFEPDELILLDQGMHLRFSKFFNVWTVVSPASYKNQFIPVKKGDTAQTKKADQFFALFGPQLTMRLRIEKGGGERLLIFPHRIERTAAGEVRVIAAERVQEAARTPLVDLTIGEGGAVKASASGSLYLAYVSMQKRDYQLAARMIEQARKGRLETEKDKELFALVAGMIRSENPMTTRSMAFQLSIEVALLAIERQQMGQIAQDPLSQEKYFTNVSRLANLHTKYEERLKKQAEAGKEISTEHELSPEVRMSSNSWRKEALTGLLLLGKLKMSREVVQETARPLVEKDLSPSILAYIAAFTKIPKKGRQISKEALIHPGLLTSEHILRYFCAYYNGIVKGNLTFQDIQVLFRPIAETHIPSEEQSELVAAADAARRFLIQAALVKEKNNAVVPDNSSINLEKIRKTKDKQTMLQEIRNPLEWVFKVNPGLLLAQTGFIEAREAAKALPSPKDAIDVETARENLDSIAETIGLSGLEKEVLEKFLTSVPSDKPITIDQFFQTIELVGLSPIEMRREQNLRNEIAAVEKAVIATAERSIDAKGAAESDYRSEPLNQDVAAFIEKLELEDWFEGREETFTKQASQAILQMRALSEVKGGSPAEQEENRQIQSGLDIVAERLNGEADYQRKVKNGQIAAVKKFLSAQLDATDGEGAQAKLAASQAEILDFAKKKLPEVRKMAMDPFYAEKDLMDVVLDLYQYGGPAVAEMEKTITTFLLWGTTVEQIKNGQASLRTIESIQGKLNSLGDVKTPQDTAYKAELELGLKQESRKLYGILKDHLNTRRYLTKDFRLKDAQTNRKFLVTEYRLKTILRPGQRQEAINITNNPKIFRSLRMGEGKTFFIMPFVAAMLIEKGYFPFMMVPPSLETVNQSDFDRTTQNVFGRRAESFRLNLDNTHSAAYLAEIYLHLLKTKQRGNYPVSSVPTMASVISLPMQLGFDRDKLVQEIRGIAKKNHSTVLNYLESEAGHAYALKLLELDKREQYARKIATLIGGKIEYSGKNEAEQLKIRSQLLKPIVKRGELLRSLEAEAREAGFSGTSDYIAQRAEDKLTGSFLEKRNNLLKEVDGQATELKMNREDYLGASGEKNLKVYKQRIAKTELGKNSLDIKAHQYGDEADSIWHISKENNRPVGDAVEVNLVIRKMCRTIFDKILDFDSGEVKGLDMQEKQSLNKLKVALLKGTQTTLKDVKNSYLRPLVKLLLQDRNFMNELPERAGKLNKKDMLQLIDYLLELGIPPNGLEWNDHEKENYENLSSLKHLLAKTLPSVLGTEPGQRFKLDEVRGCRAVPAEQGAEEEGSQYGYEYDIVAFEFLAHIQVQNNRAASGQTEEAYKEALTLILDRNPNFFGRLKADCLPQDAKITEDQQRLIEQMAEALIKNPALGKERMVIMDKFVFDRQMIRRFPEQITVPLQSTSDAPGGITGSLRPFSLFFDPAVKQKGSTRQVEAETCVRAAMTNSNGLKTEVTAIIDTDSAKLQQNFEEILNDPDCVAIANGGGYGLEGKTMTAWITELHGLFQQGREKDLVWFEKSPDGATRLYIWEVGKNAHREVTFEELKGREQPFIGIYGPQFTRGADLPLQIGKAYCLPSRDTNPQEFMQMIYRARDIGGRHRIVFRMPESVTGSKKWTIEQVYQWVFKQGVETQLPLNLMAQNFRIANIATSGLKRFLYSQAPEELDDSFRSPENVPTAYVLGVANAQIRSHLRDYFVKSKAVDFKGDLAPAEKGSTKQVLEQRYDAEIHRIQKKQVLLACEMRKVTDQLLQDIGQKAPDGIAKKLDLDAKDTPLFYENLLEVKDLSKDERTADLFRDLTSENFAVNERAEALLLTQLFSCYFFDAYKKTEGSDYTRLERALSQAEEKLTNQIFKVAFAQKAQKGGRLTRAAAATIGRFQGGRDLMLRQGGQKSEAELKAEIFAGISSAFDILSPGRGPQRAIFRRFAAAADVMWEIEQKIEQEKGNFLKYFDTHYQKYLPKKIDKRASKSGTQEQVQQQQQQQVPIQKKKRKAAIDQAGQTMAGGDDYYQISFRSYIEPEKSAAGYNPNIVAVENWSTVGVYASKVAKQLLDLPSEATSAFFYYIVNKKDDVILITNGDYGLSLDRAFLENNLAVYSPLPLENGTDPFIDGSANRVLSEIAMERIAVLKLSIGVAKFSHGELEGLKRWWKKVPPEERNSIGKKLMERQQGSLLDSLKKG